ncbi:MAG: T9SS type A sorting domain-containing protein, partial [Bacteroidota bacterium]
TVNFAAMNRYWNVYPTTQPSSPVAVRFYYSVSDLQDLQGSNSRIQDITKSFFFKVDNTNNPHDLSIPSRDFHEYTYHATTASITQWTDGNHQGFDYAEYVVHSFSGGGGGTGAKSSSLPVELIYFGVEEVAETIALKWTTSSELNTRGFNIEHSENGLDWEIIGFVAAQGNTSIEQNYRYDHQKPQPGTHYYRLHIIDFDDYSDYSSIQSIGFQNHHFQAEVFPNPMSEKDIIQYYHTGEALVAIRIYDMHGKTLHLVEGIALDQNSITLTQPLSAGMYLVAFETAHKRTLSKLVVQK